MIALPARPRRGVALLAALWLVVMITTVGAQFAIASQERRALGLSASDRTRDRAALAGALATLQAQLEQDLRVRRTTGAGTAALQSADPWFHATTTYAAPIAVGDVLVDVSLVDLGAVRDLNVLGELELRQLFGVVLRDARLAEQLAQAVLDWRDLDDLPRPSGGEADDYVREGRLVLPTNAALRDVSDLAHVRGMTPELVERVRPFLTTQGTLRRVNLNSAPEPVLRTVPGMTDALLATILAQRSAGRRIVSVPALLGASRALSGSEGAGLAQQVQRLTDVTTLETRDLLVTFTVRDAASATRARLEAVVQRSGETTTTVQSVRW